MSADSHYTLSLTSMEDAIGLARALGWGQGDTEFFGNDGSRQRRPLVRPGQTCGSAASGPDVHAGRLDPKLFTLWLKTTNDAGQRIEFPDVFVTASRLHVRCTKWEYAAPQV